MPLLMPKEYNQLTKAALMTRNEPVLRAAGERINVADQGHIVRVAVTASALPHVTRQDDQAESLLGFRLTHHRHHLAAGLLYRFKG